MWEKLDPSNPLSLLLAAVVLLGGVLWRKVEKNEIECRKDREAFEKARTQWQADLMALQAQWKVVSCTTQCVVREAAEFPIKFRKKVEEGGG